MEFTTLAPIVMCVLIAALLAFWLFAPAKAVGNQLNATGGFIQWVITKVKSLFAKKQAASTPAPTVSILPVDPPKTEAAPTEEKK